MGRKTFVEIVRSGDIDIKHEYNTLLKLLYLRHPDIGKTLHDILDENFIAYRHMFSSTCMTLSDFEKIKNIKLSISEEEIDEDALIFLCEYMRNILRGLKLTEKQITREALELNVDFVFEQIQVITEKLMYTEVHDGMLIKYVPKSPETLVVAESDRVSSDFSHKILMYSHYSLKGDLESKKQIIVRLMEIVEPYRPSMKNQHSQIEDDLFWLANNVHIRHNNTAPQNEKWYRPHVANMNETELEEWYDEIYRMCLLAILEIEHYDRKPKIKELKNLIKAPKKTKSTSDTGTSEVEVMV